MTAHQDSVGRQRSYSSCSVVAHTIAHNQPLRKHIRSGLSDPLLSCGACNELQPFWISPYGQCPAEGVEIIVVRGSPMSAREEDELSDPADDLLRVCILTANKLRQ